MQADRGSREATGSDHWIEPGDYLCSNKRLVRIEQVGEERVVVEDCLTLDVFDMPLPSLAFFRRVRRGHAARA